MISFPHRTLSAPVVLVSLALATLGLAGCANGPRTGKPIAGTTTASMPAAVPGYDWFYDDGGPEPHLTYGVEASDDLKLGLSCRPGDGKLSLSATGSSGETEIHLESGGETARIHAQSEPSPLQDGSFLTAEAATTLPVFQRFRRVGWMAIFDGSHRTVMAPHSGSAARIERFFTACG